MRIMFTIYSLGGQGGAEKIQVIIANYLVSIGHEVIIVSLDNRKVNFKIDERIHLLFHMPKKNNVAFAKGILLTLEQIVFIKNTIIKIKPDVVIGFVSATNILTIIAALMTKTPVIISEHSSYHRALKNRFWKWLRRVVYPFANKSIVLTQEDKPKYSYVKEVTVIQNPLILNAEYTHIQRKKTILSVGRLHNVKGFDLLIEAFSKINAIGWKLSILGEGSERKKLEALVKKLNIADKVEFLGFVDNVELYYKQAAIYALSSRSEGFPGGLCEAMGYGCACVAFDCPTGPKEIISDGVDGLLVEAENVNALATALQSLIDDKSKREKIGGNAQKISERLNIEVIGKKWEETIIHVVKNFKEIVSD